MQKRLVVCTFAIALACTSKPPQPGKVEQPLSSSWQRITVAGVEQDLQGNNMLVKVVLEDGCSMELRMSAAKFAELETGEGCQLLLESKKAVVITTEIVTSRVLHRVPTASGETIPQHVFFPPYSVPPPNFFGS
ncbi:MAG: hypothetical protein DCC75_00760 [Proteobacteria bacterium]|nr:MAG: hypothetical protein DCC75_00760 [Pseudomonadota bacterium]